MAAYRTLRLTARTNLLQCTIAESEVVVAAPFIIDRFPIRAGGDASRLLELPGTTVRIVNTRPDACPISLEVYGRPN